MSEVQKQKQHPIPPRLEAQLKSKGASLPTQDDYGGAGNAVKGQDERPKTAPLTAFPAPMLSCALFTLDSGRCRHTWDDKVGVPLCRTRTVPGTPSTTIDENA